MKRSRLFTSKFGQNAEYDVSLGAMRRRLASGAGAIVLGLVAIVFAQMGDLAQHLFLQFDRRWPYAALVTTPLLFAGVVYVTNMWCTGAK